MVTRLAAALAFVLTLALPAPAQDVERFTAFAVDLSNVAAGTTSQVDITISRWSTEAERDRLVKTFMEKSQRDLLAELQKIKPPVGKIAVPGTVGWDLRYARQIPGEDGGRQIVILTDRQMSFRELSQRPRSVDYPFTLIEMRLDKDGYGEGRASIATMITYDKESRTLELENFASEPVRLNEIRKIQ